MADTPRTVADLIGLLPLATLRAGSIQDVRDLIVSLAPSMGSMYVSTPAQTTIGVAGTYVKAAGTWTQVSSVSGLVMQSNGRLVQTLDVARHYHIAASLSMTAQGANQTAGFKIAKNGVVLDHSYVARKITTGADIGGHALHADVQLVKDDYLELWLTNETSTNWVQLNAAYLFAVGHIVPS
jgi:hypothetical protein